MTFEHSVDQVSVDQGASHLSRSWWLWLIGIGAAIELMLWISTMSGYEVFELSALLNSWLLFCAMGLTMVGLGLAATADRENPFGYVFLGLFPITGPLGYLAWLVVDGWYEMQQDPTRVKMVIRWAAGLVIVWGSIFTGLWILVGLLERA